MKLKQKEMIKIKIKVGMNNIKVKEMIKIKIKVMMKIQLIQITLKEKLLKK